MSDPIDELENFDPGAPMTPLPPSEVRRLGDRHRRRRTAGVVLAAAAAVAVVAAGSAVLAGGETRTLDPAPSPSGPLIPDSLDVTVGMSENESGEPVTQVHGGVGLTRLDLCGVTPFADDGRLDSVSAVTGGPKYGDIREAVLYPDEQSAAQALERVEASARDCARQESAPGWPSRLEVRAWDAGESGFVLVRTYTNTNTLGGGILHFTRVGEAVLAAETADEYTRGNTASAEAEQSRRLTPVVNQLCVLYNPDCASGTAVGTTPPDSDDIPEDFPLAAGWPDQSQAEPGQGLTGPGPAVPALEDLTVCGAVLPVPQPRDRLAATWSNPEDYRIRLLLTFEDADAAIAYQGQLLDPYRACPRSEQDADGNASVTDVRRTQVGGESWAVVRSFEFQGRPSIGLEVLHVVRLGRAVLVDVTSSEGMASSAQATITAQTEATADVVAAMCAFTVAGC